MKDRIRFCFTQLVLVCALVLGSLGSPAALNAQTPDTPDAPPKVYLPLISIGGEPDLVVDEDVIPGQFIVVFKDEMVMAAGISATAAELTTALSGELLYTYDSGLIGFALKLPTEAVTDALTMLQNDARISYVEPDRFVRLDPVDMTEDVAAGIELTTSDVTLESAGVDAVETVQINPPWGLDRIDQRALPLNQQYNYQQNGAGVVVFVIDSGIRITHNEFQGRASYGADAVDKTLPADDCDGHGTHVAGTIGGKTYGVAKGVTLKAVRVLNCISEGTVSQAIDGINYVNEFRDAHPTTPMVVNMSFSSEYNPDHPALDDAVLASINKRIIYVVAAGNQYKDACRRTPARVAAAITVGATDSVDGRPSFSNFGSCLDIFAPGVAVRSAWRTSDTSTATISGTSMAAPHVAGIAALYLQGNPNATPAQVAAALTGIATPNVVSNPGSSSPNRLLYTPPTCFPEHPTVPMILGSDGNDSNLTGTANSERICGLVGTDVIFGAGGNDFLQGNTGSDTVNGEAGDDLLHGGQNNDTLNGGDGDDTLYGGLGDDTLNGNIGNDTVAGGDGNDTVRGGQNNDTVWGDAGNDIIYGGNGDDTLWGGTGADTFSYTAGNGNDVINDFQWSMDKLQLSGVTIQSYTQLGADCRLNLSTTATIRLVNVGICRTPTVG